VESAAAVKDSASAAAFHFSAVQLVNHFLECFESATGDRRLDKLMECFAENVVISSLKSGKTLIDGKAALSRSFANVEGHDCSSIFRVFLEKAASNVTFVVDVHEAGKLPGLGVPDKDGVLMYR